MTLIEFIVSLAVGIPVLVYFALIVFIASQERYMGADRCKPPRPMPAVPEAEKTGA